MDKLCSELSSNGIPYMLMKYEKVALLSSHCTSKNENKTWFITFRTSKQKKTGKIRKTGIIYKIEHINSYGDKNKLEGTIREVINYYNKCKGETDSECEYIEDESN